MATTAVSCTPSLPPSPPPPLPLPPSLQLHQLLTEQLQDDLLDDSVSTVTTEDGAADSTLLGDEVDMSLDHVISPHQSCDLLHNDGKDQSAVEDPYSAQHGTNMGSSSSEQVAPTGNNQVSDYNVMYNTIES